MFDDAKVQVLLLIIQYIVGSYVSGNGAQRRWMRREDLGQKNWSYSVIQQLYVHPPFQMNKVEQDLEKCRTSREKQAKEFTRQIENERVRQEKLVRKILRNDWIYFWRKLRKVSLLFQDFRVEDFVWTRENVLSARTPARERSLEQRAWEREGTFENSSLKTLNNLNSLLSFTVGKLLWETAKQTARRGRSVPQ